MAKARFIFTLIWCLLLAAAVAPAPLAAQVRLSLEQVSKDQATRRGGGADTPPPYEGREIATFGTVSARMYHVQDRLLLPIQDESQHALVLFGTSAQLASFLPGDQIDVVGTIANGTGIAALTVSSIRRVATGPPPVPLHLPVDRMASFDKAGLLVSTESVVTAIDPNPEGDVATIGERDRAIQVLLPRAHHLAASGFGFLTLGDRVRTTGTLLHLAKQPPLGGGFYIVLYDASGIGLAGRQTFLPPLLLLSALGATSLMLIIWWIRERRMSVQRRSMRTLHALSEQITAAETPAEIARRLADVFPGVTAFSTVRLYVFNARTRSLERVVTSDHPEPMAFSVDAPPPGMPTGVGVCFRNRRLLAIPDTRRSPFLKSSARADMPRSALFVPMFAHQELLGVLELAVSGRPHYFTQEEQASAQHIANQVATALKLQEQQTIREQLFRSEKLAATGQLISGVASELRAPLDTILRLATDLSANHSANADREARLLAIEARRASEIVSRLVSFARNDDVQAKPVEVNQLLNSLIEFRAPEWSALGINLHSRLSSDLIYVHGAQGQLEQVFLNLIVHAEQSVDQGAQAGEKSITIASSLIARRVLIEVSFPAPANAADPLSEQTGGMPASATGLAVCRGILQTHGGEIYYRIRNNAAKFEVELPVESARPPGSPAGSGTSAPRRTRALTALVVDSDSAALRQTVMLLSSRSHRVVPVGSNQEAVDLVQRLRFDCVFFAVRPANPNWMEMFDRIRAHSSATVLITDGFDPDLQRPGTEYFSLSRPIQDAELDLILDIIGNQKDTPTGAPRPAKQS